MNKLARIALVLLLFIGMAINVQGKGNDTKEYTVVWYNPMYGEFDFEEKSLAAPAVSQLTTTQKTGYETDKAKAVDIVRNALLDRRENLEISFVQPEGETYALFDSVTLAFAHTGIGEQGDFIRFHVAGYKITLSVDNRDGLAYCTYRYELRYHTTKAQETALTSRLSSVYASLGMEGLTNYEKLDKIYGYITSHVTYDHENLNNENYKLKFTAYAAVVNGKAVCQGYASLLYRMCLDNGIDARVITGKGRQEDHAWNIARIGDYYYNLDATWDASTKSRENYLKCNTTFRNHTRVPEYSSGSFNRQYPMAISDLSKYVHVSSVFFRQETYHVQGLSSVTLLYTVQPYNATEKNVSFSYDKTKLRIDETGNATVLVEGSFVVTLTTMDGGLNARCTVQVDRVPIASMSVAKQELVKVGASKLVPIAYSPSHASDLAFGVKVDNPMVANAHIEGTSLRVIGANEGRTKITVSAAEASTSMEVIVSADPLAVLFGFSHSAIDGLDYWYEDGTRQGVQGDPKNIYDEIYGEERGREIYDPVSDGWYWLDKVRNGAKANDKEAWIPYIFQDEKPGSTRGKWVRYNHDGKMIKGWYTVQGADAVLYPSQTGNTYYYDWTTGEMYKGDRMIDGKWHRFDEISGVLQY